MKKNAYFIVLIFLLCTSCSKDETTFQPKDYKIKGKVEKGPFVNGSTITLQELDASMNPTGKSFNGTISDNEGSFDIGTTKLSTPYALLSANGYYFNEVTGRLSSGQISLQALVDLSDKETVNVNILTHLKKDRILKLIKEDELSFKEANKQVQNELLDNFGLKEYATNDVSLFSIASGTNEAGALIVVSSVLLQNKSDAEFTEYIASLRNDFTTNGSFQQSTKDDLWNKTIKLNFSSIADNIVKRYNSLGKEVSVKDLSRFVDWDKDGIAGNELGEEGVNAKINFEKDTLTVPSSGGEYEIKIDANIPFTFETIDSNSGATSSYNSSTTNLFTIGKIAYSRELTANNILKIKVNPSDTRIMEPLYIKAYSYDGKTTDCLTIIQQINYSKPLTLTNGGNSILNSIGSNMVKTLSLMHTIESIYTQCWSHTQWLTFYNHTLNSSNNQISQLFSGYYQIITILNTIEKRYNEPYINSAFSGIEALLYYQMGVLWGNIPYVTSANLEGGTYAIQMQSKEFLALFEKDLLSCINSFSSEKTNNTTAEGMIFPSKDVPRMILARMYMYNGEYAKALPLLQDIINSNNYSLEANRLTAVKKESRELIYSFSLDNVVDNTFKNVIEANDVIPVITYAEVLLSTAECEYRLGNNSGAITYLNKVDQNRGLPSATTSNIITSLQATWKSELKGTGTYFAFLKRNGLAEQALNIQSYKILLPIPQNQLNYNPNIIQNPGY